MVSFNQKAIKWVDYIKENQHQLIDWLAKKDFKVQRDIPKNPDVHQASSFIDQAHVRHYDDGRLLIFNLLPDEIRALELFENKIRDSFLELDNVVKSRSNKEPNLKRVESNLDFQRAYSYCFKDLNKMYPYNSECVHFTFVRT